MDGHGHPLPPGARVAVDPAQPCGRCEWCLRGDPNVCPQIVFCGVFPHKAHCGLDAYAGRDLFSRARRDGRHDRHDAGAAGRSDPLAGSGEGPVGRVRGRDRHGSGRVVSPAAGGGRRCGTDLRRRRVALASPLAAQFGPSTAFDAGDTNIVEAVLDATPAAASTWPSK